MSLADDDQNFILEALPAFMSETSEQLATLEELLLELEERPDDRQLLDALFRTAHTIKGSAGIFGLDSVVAFTHHVETLLDRLREGLVTLSPPMSTLLLRCGDAIRHLIEAAGQPALDSADHQAQREALVRQLQEQAGIAPGSDVDASLHPAAPAAAPATPEVASTDARGWHIDVRFGPETFRNGMDPLALLYYLETLGELRDVRIAHEAIPALDALDPETCHIVVQANLHGDIPLDPVESAFSFVREDSDITIAPLHAGPSPQSTEPAASSASTVPSTAPAGSADATQTGVSALPGAPRAIHPGAQPAVPASPAAAGKARGAADENRYIRVQADRLDTVINLLGELVVASAGAELMARHTRNTTLIEANLHIGRLIEEIRNGTLQLRMVPIGETFNRFRRVVRDTAADLGKDVEFEIEGGETELDKSVVEKIADPLMHLVRNALDHGLENPAERTAAGKPAQGRLLLAARHEAGSIIITIRDNGRGIHRQKVLQRAWERGVVERGVVPPDADILNLIFAAGFSTAEQVTNLSGRGVGMDVVRSNIEALRGSVHVQSTEGEGTEVNIQLPLTLAIIDGFLVSVGSSKFILPLESVVEVIESRQPATAPSDASRRCVELRGKVLPVLSLRDLYGIAGEPPARVSTVVVQTAQGRYGVIVDHLLGQHQTVIKPLGRMFRSLRGLSGSSILGNGEVALIFDVNSLAQLSSEAVVAKVSSSSSTPSSTPLTGKGH